VVIFLVEKNFVLKKKKNKNVDANIDENKFEDSSLSKLSFIEVLKTVIARIILRIELRMTKFKKREFINPVIMAPWRGFRLGLAFLMKNVKNQVQYIKRDRKRDYLYKILTEFMEIYYGKGSTCKNVYEFHNKVMEYQSSFRNHRSKNFAFGVKKHKQYVVYLKDKKFLEMNKIKKKKLEFYATLEEEDIKKKKKRIIQNVNLIKKI